MKLTCNTIIILLNFVLILANCYESNFNITPHIYYQDLREETSEMQPKSSISFSYEEAIYSEFIYKMNISRISDEKRFLYQEIIESQDDVFCQIIQNQITLKKKQQLDYSLDIKDYEILTMREKAADSNSSLRELNDQETVEKIKKVFLITEDFDLIILIPDEENSKFKFDKEISLGEVSNFEKSNIFLKLFNETFLIIVSQQKIITVPYQINSTDDIVFQENFLMEAQILSISSIKIVELLETNYLIISANTEGVIIYELDSTGKMARISHTINQELSKTAQINITDSVLIEQTLYCLDYNQGLHAINLLSSFEIDKNHGFILPKIKKGKQLAQSNNTLIIPTDQDPSLNNQAGIYEVFVYPPDKWILNHEEFYPSTLKRIEIGKRYYLAIFLTTHLIIPHSMFAEFMPVDFNSYISKYSFSHLLFGRFINDLFADAELPQLIHITANGIYQHEFQESSFQVKCSTSEHAQSQTVSFENQFIARRCAAKDNAQDQSKLNACLLKKQFVISVYQYFKKSETKWVALIISAIILVVLSIIAITAFIWYKKCYVPVEKLKKKVEEMEKIKYQTLKNQQEIQET